MKTVIFDMDGVITDTASVHAKAWKTAFEEATQFHTGKKITFTHDDYVSYVDGRVRLIGVQSYLNYIRLELPVGCETDVSFTTAYGIGNIKNKEFVRLLAEQSISVFQDALDLITLLKSLNYPLAIGSASKNARMILERTNLVDNFDFILDGLVADIQGVKSKPHGDFYGYACELANSPPSSCIVIEDAISGIKSAKSAGIGCIIGVCRGVTSIELYDAGADIVVNSLVNDSVIEFFSDTVSQ
jgi:HAD superfamily hydrolase (TIGR01509 family)